LSCPEKNNRSQLAAKIAKMEQNISRFFRYGLMLAKPKNRRKIIPMDPIALPGMTNISSSNIL
jgi:hypothetical protein